VIPNNAEKTLAVICDKFYFIDSFRFLNFSLSALVKNLRKTCCDDEQKLREKFSLLYQRFTDPELVNLLLMKGVYPYSYVSSWDVFEENK